MVDRLGRLWAAGIGLSVMIVAFFMFTQANSFFSYLGSMAVLGAGSSIVWSSLLTLTVEIVPDQKGTISSIFNSARDFGYSMAPVVFTPLYVAIRSMPSTIWDGHSRLGAGSNIPCCEEF